MSLVELGPKDRNLVVELAVAIANSVRPVTGEPFYHRGASSLESACEILGALGAATSVEPMFFRIHDEGFIRAALTQELPAPLPSPLYMLNTFLDLGEIKLKSEPFVAEEQDVPLLRALEPLGFCRFDGNRVRWSQKIYVAMEFDDARDSTWCLREEERRDEWLRLERRELQQAEKLRGNAQASTIGNKL